MGHHRFTARNIDPHADNAIHADDVAQEYGLTAALVPGVELLAGATSPLVAAWGQQWLAHGHLGLRFRVHTSSACDCPASPDSLRSSA